MEALTFANSYNLVAYLEKSKANADFAKIVDFLNASSIRYALTVSLTIYVSYIEQFWSTAKFKTVNNEIQIRAKVNGKTIVITESSMRRDLHFGDEDVVFNEEYDTPSHTKKVFANMRRKGKDFSGTVTPLLATMLIPSQAVEGEGSGQPTEPQHTPTTVSPSHISHSSRPTTLVADETVHEERGDNVERAATTATSLDAEQGSVLGAKKPLGITLLRLVKEESQEVGKEKKVKNSTTQEQGSAPVATAGVSVSTAEPSTPPTTTTIFIEDEDLTIAQTLMKMRSVKSKEKSKEKGVSSETTTRLTRGVIMKEASNATLIEEWDSIKARVYVDAQLAERLQAEEREHMSVGERARLLMEFIAARKKFFVAKRAEEQRNKPPTKAEQRKKMCIYMKHMAGYKDKNFKGKSFDAIKQMFDKAYKEVNDFVLMDTESSRKKVVSKKIAGERPSKESAKRQKIEDDAEKAELKACLEIVPGDDIAVNIESLATKYPIVDWKTHIIAEYKMYYQIIRADGSTKYYKIFSAMLDDFDRKDVLDLYKLGRIVRIKSLLSAVEVTAASMIVTTAGFQNPFYLKKAQQLEPTLYDGNVIKNNSAIVIPDSEETLMLAEESRSRMLLKQKDPMMLEKKVNTTLVDYANSVNSPDPTLSSRPTKVEVPKELPKVSMVNTSLKKLKHHLAGFDVVVKERTTATAITEGSWGFEHTKACFRDEIIPFVKALKDLFNTFDQYLIDELFEVQNVFQSNEQL
ncbi:hypothetical protein Tco_1437292 [Tanacetum coccineum]